MLAERRQTTVPFTQGVGEWSASAPPAVTAAFGQAGGQTAPRQGRTLPARGAIVLVWAQGEVCLAPADVRIWLAGAGVMADEGVKCASVVSEEDPEVAPAAREFAGVGQQFHG